MKYVMLLGVVLGLWVCSAKAQNRSIRFETGTWAEAIAKANKEHKLIFVDCYTSWCGPCKKLSKAVFTRDAVADFYNSNFINVKLDMEKGEGVALKGKLGVKAFPTLLYVDDAGGVVHTVVGYVEPEELIRQGELAVKPKDNLSGLRQRYRAGERGKEFMKTYMDALTHADIPEEQQEVALEYLNTLSAEELATPENWAIIDEHVFDPFSHPLQQVRKNRPLFDTLAGREHVDRKLIGSLYASLVSVVGEIDRPAIFDAVTYKRLKDYLMTSDLSCAPAFLARLYAGKAAAEKDYRLLMEEMDKALSLNIFWHERPVNYIMTCIGSFKVCEDNAGRREAAEWLERLIPYLDHPYQYARVYGLKSELLAKVGDEAGAAAAKKESKRFMDEGTRMMEEEMQGMDGGEGEE